MKLKVTTILFLFLTISVFSQNLVINGDFENYSHCPLITDDLSVDAWDCGAGTIDYFNKCGFYIYCGLPINHLGFCYPLSGDGCLGMIVSSTVGAQEFALGRLSSPLKKGEIYKVKFYVKPGDLKQSLSTWNIGIKFSDTLLFDTIWHQRKVNFPFIHADHYINTVFPDKIRPDVANPTNNYLTNETGWTEICDYFVAKGGEKFLYIGGFYFDSEQNNKEVNRMINNKVDKSIKYLKFYNDSILNTKDFDLQIDKKDTWLNAYYFIDNVSVTKHDNQIRDDITKVLPNISNESNTLYLVFQNETNKFSAQSPIIVDNIITRLKESKDTVIVFPTLWKNGSHSYVLEQARFEKVFKLLKKNKIDRGRFINYNDFLKGEHFLDRIKRIKANGYLQLIFLQEEDLKLNQSYDKSQNCYCDKDKLELLKNNRQNEISITDYEVGEFFILPEIRFQFNEAILLDGSYVIIDNLAAELSENIDIEIEIVGHTDSIGTDEYNMDLSLQRAKSVFDYLVTLGIESRRLKYIGKGSSEPVSDNDTKEGQMENRRVEFIITQK